MSQLEDITRFFPNLNWGELEAHVQELEIKFPKSGLNPKWNGWSILSKTGEYMDGWSPSYNLETNKKKMEDTVNHINPTEIITPTLSGLIDELHNIGLAPARMRYIQLAPNTKAARHRDGYGELALRVHFVIKTNPECFFNTDYEHKHLEHRHVYLINVDDYHWVENNSTHEIRTHLIACVQDTKQISRVHGVVTA